MMASVPPPFASMECGSLRKHECSGLSCAWKAPRAMTGSLASTARGHCAAQDGWRRQRCGTALRGASSTRSEVLHTACFNSPQGVHPFISRNHGKSPVRSVFGRCWELHSKSSDSESSDALSPESLWEDLEPVISYLPSEELDLVYHALKLAYKAHHGQKRRSGQPFIIHPVEVARILGELELDWESIAAGLLHDTVEDTTLVTFERIEREFGATVRNIVEGETKVSKLGKLKCKDSSSSKQDVKADDLRQMFLAMTEEVRVIIVKLADRLHNMRTLAHMPPGKQSSIAMETLQVFAPLAKLLGMYQIKSELESLSFMYSNAKDFANIKQKTDEFYMKHKKELAEAKNSLKQKIDDDRLLQLMPLKAEIRSVCKEPYSVYKKLKGSINDMNLVAQISIIVQSKNCTGLGSLYNAEQLCYHILGLVHGIWTPIPSTVKDFIATPKPNGYQSLHTTVIPFLYESMLRVEVQIRTEEMDLIARRGIAAHYSGKVASNLGRQSMNSRRSSRTKSICLNNADIALRIGWLNAIREWQEEFVGNMSSREFVDTIMRDLLGSRVFVFTPKGEIKNLPKGATTIDYAYLIHTEIGNKMVAAKVNGNMVPPEHVLENAEVVEIITYNALSSISAFRKHERWLKHAKTRSARHKIMKFLREQATISATELTADAVNNFIADMEEDNAYEMLPDRSKGIPKWNKLRDIAELTSKISSENPLPANNFLGFPKINGKNNRSMQPVSINLNSQQTAGGYGFPPFFLATSADKEVLLGLESWKDSKVALWHNVEGHPIQWFCVVCIDQRGIMMTEVTSALTAASITICSCVAEMDRKKGLGVMLFHIEATLENLASACSGIDLILGVLGWSAGCSWCHPSAGQNYPEC